MNVFGSRNVKPFTFLAGADLPFSASTIVSGVISPAMASPLSSLPVPVCHCIEGGVREVDTENIGDRYLRLSKIVHTIGRTIKKGVSNHAAHARYPDKNRHQRAHNGK